MQDINFTSYKGYDSLCSQWLDNKRPMDEVLYGLTTRHLWRGNSVVWPDNKRPMEGKQCCLTWQQEPHGGIDVLLTCQTLYKIYLGYSVSDSCKCPDELLVLLWRSVPWLEPKNMLQHHDITIELYKPQITKWWYNCRIVRWGPSLARNGQYGRLTKFYHNAGPTQELIHSLIHS
jgi:hypothetical protein